MARARNILLIVFYNENWYIYGIIPFQYALCWYRYLLLSFEWDKSSRFLSVDILDSIQFSMDFFFLLQFKSTYVFPLGTWHFFISKWSCSDNFFFGWTGTTFITIETYIISLFSPPFGELMTLLPQLQTIASYARFLALFWCFFYHWRKSEKLSNSVFILDLSKSEESKFYENLRLIIYIGHRI